jgi:cobalt-zinc-cadmium efflux system outer membrane protein
MNARTWMFVGATAFCLASTTPAPAAESLEEVAGVRRVCAAGPDSAVARAQRQRGAAAVTAADVLPNPSLVVEHQRTLSGPTEHETIVGLAVPLGIGGRRFLLQDAAAARREQALLDAHVTLFEAALAFREAYVAAALDRSRVVVLTEQQAALDGLTLMIQKLAKGGEAAGYDQLRQQTHARLHRRLLDSMKARASASRVLLEGWTGSEVTLPAVALADLAGGQRTAPPPGDDAAARHPRVRSLTAESRASALEARAARRRWVPDLEIFAGYRSATVASDTGHGVSLSVTVPLTLFDHGQGEAARAEADQEVARTTADGVRRLHQARLKAARVRLEELSASVAEMDKATVDAATLQDKAKQLYAAGEASITELLEAFRGAEEARLGRIDLAEEIALARLALMRSAGTLFDAGLDKACAATQGAQR